MQNLYRMSYFMPPIAAITKEKEQNETTATQTHYYKE